MAKVFNIEDFRYPVVGEWAFSSRFGLRRVSAISECGWWYSFEGEGTSVSKASVRRARKEEIEVSLK